MQTTINISDETAIEITSRTDKHTGGQGYTFKLTDAWNTMTVKTSKTAKAEVPSIDEMQVDIQDGADHALSTIALMAEVIRNVWRRTDVDNDIRNHAFVVHA